jgi:hypothetical protein
MNRITDATKIVIFAATIIIVCVVCALGFKMVNEGKSAVSNGTNQYNTMAADYNDINVANYDGACVLGSEVVNFINKQITKATSVTVTVKTLADSTGVTYNPTPGAATPALSTSVTTTSYINSSASFSGKITKNANGIITNVTFTQIK